MRRHIPWRHSDWHSGLTGGQALTQVSNLGNTRGRDGRFSSLLLMQDWWIMLTRRNRFSVNYSNCMQILDGFCMKTSCPWPTKGGTLPLLFSTRIWSLLDWEMALWCAWVCVYWLCGCCFEVIECARPRCVMVLFLKWLTEWIYLKAMKRCVWFMSRDVWYGVSGVYQVVSLD